MKKNNFEEEELREADELIATLSRKADERENDFVADYSEDPPVIPVYEDIDALESVEIPSAKENKKKKKKTLEETMDLKLIDIEETIDINLIDETKDLEIINEIAKEEKKKDKERLIESKKGKLKKYGKRLMVITGFFIPILITLICISINSTKLVTKNIAVGVVFALGFLIGIFLYGLFLYLQNIKAKKSKRMSALGRHIYILFMTTYIGLAVGFVYVMYGPYEEFREWFITNSVEENKIEYCRWFYSDDTINEVMQKKGDN